MNMLIAVYLAFIEIGWWFIETIPESMGSSQGIEEFLRGHPKFDYWIFFF